MSDDADDRPQAGAREPQRVRAADLKPGDRFTTDRAPGEFVVESVDGASAYRVVRTTVGKVFGLPRELMVRVYPEPAPDDDA
ncbi:MAG: hypothetical protein ACRDLS_10255 [Solirubrobacteraceae bacterium]